MLSLVLMVRISIFRLVENCVSWASLQRNTSAPKLGRGEKERKSIRQSVDMMFALFSKKILSTKGYRDNIRWTPACRIHYKFQDKAQSRFNMSQRSEVVVALMPQLACRNRETFRVFFEAGEELSRTLDERVKLLIGCSSNDKENLSASGWG